MRRAGLCAGYTTVRCAAPPHAAGWVRLTVGAGGASPGEAFEFRQAPLLHLATPAEGAAAGGTLARALGEHLHAVDACWFGAAPRRPRGLSPRRSRRARRPSSRPVSRRSV